MHIPGSVDQPAPLFVFRRAGAIVAVDLIFVRLLEVLCHRRIKRHLNGLSKRQNGGVNDNFIQSRCNCTRLSDITSVTHLRSGPAAALHVRRRTNPAGVVMSTLEHLKQYYGSDRKCIVQKAWFNAFRTATYAFDMYTRNRNAQYKFVVSEETFPTNLR